MTPEDGARVMHVWLVILFVVLVLIPTLGLSLYNRRKAAAIAKKKEDREQAYRHEMLAAIAKGRRS